MCQIQIEKKENYILATLQGEVTLGCTAEVKEKLKEYAELGPPGADGGRRHQRCPRSGHRRCGHGHRRRHGCGGGVGPGGADVRLADGHRQGL